MPHDQPKSLGEASPYRFARYVWGIALGWSLLLAVLLAIGVRQAHRQVIAQAQAQARGALAKDFAYRSWAAIHGGLYAPVTGRTVPSPYLAGIAERDIVTPSGRRLTLINPAYMTRQVHEMAADSYGQHGHITSLAPIRPENRADAWETGALQSFSRGGREYSERTEMEGQPYFRLMRAFVTEKGCLSCHAIQGYKVGDVRGGISVSIPLFPYLETARAEILYLAASFSAVWALGLAGLAAGVRRLRRRMGERDQARQLLRESELVFGEFLEHSPIYVFFRDENARILSLSRNYEALLGKPLEKLLGRRLDEVYPPALARRMAEEDRRILKDGRAVVEEEEVNGRICKTIKAPISLEGKPRCIAGYAVDITGQRRAEEKMARMNERLSLAARAGQLGIWDWDVAANRLDWDDRMLEFYGLKKEEFNGTYEAWLGAVHPGDRARCDAETQLALRAEDKYDSEFRVLRPDGGVRYIKAAANIFRDGAGKVKRMVGVNSDVTGRRLAELELERLNRELAGKNRELEKPR